MQLTKCFFLILISMFLCSRGMVAQEMQLKFVQKGTQNPVQFVNVQWQTIKLPQIKGGTTADFGGVANIPLKEGTFIKIATSCIGYKSATDTIQLKSKQEIYLEEDVLNLDQVTVTGTRTPHVLKEAPVLTQLISSKELMNIDSETITDILEVEMPGVEMANHGGVPVLNMMGLETQYSLVLIDGERMAKSLQKTIDYSRINTANIERIEIIRGASSALYGSDAMGGVINIITKKPSKKLDVTASVRYQERNSKDHTQADIDNADDQYARDFYKNIDRQNLNSNVAVGYRNNGFYSNTFFNYKSTDGYQLKNKEGVKRYYKRLNKEVQMPIQTGATSVNGFEDFTVSQKLGYQKEKWSVDLKGSLYNHDEFDFSNDATHKFYRSYNYTGRGKYNLDTNSSLELSHSSDIYQRFNFDEKKKTKNKTHSNAYNTSKLIYNRKAGRHTLLFELENQYQTLETDKFVTGQLREKSTNDAVAVLQDEFIWTDKLAFVAGLRAGYHSTFDFHMSPSLTAKYDINKFNLRVSYARGFRSPDLKELYMNWSHLGMFQILGNKNLKPETNNYYSFSVDFIDAAHNLNATIITSYNDVKDKIDGVWSNNETEYRYLNFNRARIFSIETLLKWQFHRSFKLKAGYIFLSSTKSTDAQDLSSMSPMSFSGQLEYRFIRPNYRLTANISGKITGRKEFDVLDSGSNAIHDGEYYKVKYPTYSIWNIAVNQYFGKHIKVGAGIKNILDYRAPIVTFNTSNTPGRKIYVSLGFQL
ncbi:TonB-dependent receptor [Prolixibacteraceae bacterium JC049]|nr:TonB-dependent receptor [Prolixibacteraceae bacterium JC049]